MAQVKFGWVSSAAKKRQRLSSASVQKELEDSLAADDERDQNAHDEWMRRQRKNILCLEDAESLSARKQEEGCVLAEAERFREAISRWQEAIDLTPKRAVLYELQAQCYLELGEIFDAVRCAEQARIHEPEWAEGLWTLGRAQLNLGEIEMGMMNLKKAAELKPDLNLSDDMHWAAQLLEKKEQLIRDQICCGDACYTSSISSQPLLRMAVGNSVCLGLPVPIPDTSATRPSPGDLILAGSRSTNILGFNQSGHQTDSSSP